MKNYDRDRMWNLFLEIWNERPHRSQISGDWLGREPLSCMFDHLLEKSKWPQFKYDKRNIILLTCSEHSAKTNGWPLQKHKEAIENAKKLLIND